MISKLTYILFHRVLLHRHSKKSFDGKKVIDNIYTHYYPLTTKDFLANLFIRTELNPLLFWHFLLSFLRCLNELRLKLLHQ